MVITPEGPAPPDGMPVLFLLHGLFGSHTNWTELTSLADYVREEAFAVVCPEGADSWYTDNPLKGAHLFETYILDELIPDAEARLGAGGDRGRRAIAGLSMGGYGAFKFAFRRPEMFCFAGSMSGAFDIRSFLANENGRWDELNPSIEGAFAGRDESDLDMEDVYRLAEAAAAAGLPRFYLDCGRDDDFLSLNRRFSETLSSAGIEHQFEEHEGGHDWDYWDKRIRTVLKLAASSFSE